VAAVAVIGVGRIGAPLIDRLVAAGHDVAATDIRPERRHDVERARATWRPDAATAAANRDTVITVLPGAPELHNLVLGPGRLLQHLDSRTIWIDLTSATFELGQGLAAAASISNVPYLGAPIGGGVEAMRDGTVTLYAGGDAGVLAAADPVLRSFATTIHHVGGPGSGYLTKLLINLLWFGQAVLTTEALLVAQQHGLPPAKMREVLTGSAGDSAFVARHLPALLAGDYLRDFGLDRCVEELDAVEQSAVSAGTPHPVTSAIAELHRAALRRYGPVDGELMAAAWLEEQAGRQLAPPGPATS
jgi:3-hydroxyisobutyrate dehydrogenase